MKQDDLEQPETWAVNTFGAVALGDPRRTDRLVRIAAALALAPAASLPKGMRNWKDTLAAYRFLDNEEMTHEQIMAQHWIQTRQEAAEHPCVLLIGDTTECNLSSQRSIEGVGPVGRGKQGRGYYIHSVLAVDASTKELLGCAYQEPFVRQSAPKQETRAQRRKRPRESQIWERSARQIGAAPVATRWVHVGDRAADIYTFWQTCEQLATGLLIRVMENRAVYAEPQEEQDDLVRDHLLDLARRLPAQDARVVPLRAEHQRPARDALVQISFQEVRIQPPENGASLEREELHGWVIHAWEPTPPRGAEPLEWVLFTTVAVQTSTDAWERVTWYRWRWILEDFHHVLKTGCRIEQRLLQTVGAQWRLLGILTPMALRLLCLRQVAQSAPDTPASEVASVEVVQVVARLAKRPNAAMSARDLWRTIASFGGYLNRTCDGPPGWKTLWQGWMYVQTVLEGVHLAASFPPL